MKTQELKLKYLFPIRTRDRARPGVKPAVPDEQLSPDELEKRKKRRERNAVAARNCRNKKEKQMHDLTGTSRTVEQNICHITYILYS